MRVALTGATGFLGSAILPLLLEAGHGVSALARQPQRVVAQGNLDVVAGTLADDRALDDLTRHVDVVVHAAGLVSAVSRTAFDAVNVEGTLRLLGAARRNGVRRFVHISSLATDQPSLNDYAASKARAESELSRFATGLACVVLRPAAIYGPGDKATLPLLKSLLARIAVLPGTALNRFSMVHVRDAARAVVESVESKAVGRFDLSDGEPAHSWPELVEITRRAFGLPSRVMYLPQPIAMALGAGGSAWGRMTGTPALINAGQMRQLYFPHWNVSEATWPLADRIGLEQGLVETIQWYQNAGMLPRTPVPDRSPAHPTTSA